MTLARDEMPLNMLTQTKEQGKLYWKKYIQIGAVTFNCIVYKVILLNDHLFIHAPDKKSYCT